MTQINAIDSGGISGRSQLMFDKDVFVHLNSFLQRLSLMDGDDWQGLNRDYLQRALISEDCYKLVQCITGLNGERARQNMHELLALIYERDFGRPGATMSWCETQPVLRDIAAIFENSMLGEELSFIPSCVIDHPDNGSEYVQWLKLLISNHPASRHPYYREYLPNFGTYTDIRFLLAQETSLDPRFDDILALIQLGTQGREKMEIGGNYWDEMGNGDHAKVHSTLFAQTLSALDIDESYIRENILFDAKLCGNLSAALALSRRHYYKAIGYFGVTEYLAPRRFRSLVHAWRRLNLPVEGIRYHDAHIEIDARHAISWLKNVIEPAIDRDPHVGRDIAIGTFVRLNTSARYLDALLARTNFFVST